MLSYIINHPSRLDNYDDIIAQELCSVGNNSQ